MKRLTLAVAALFLAVPLFAGTTLFPKYETVRQGLLKSSLKPGSRIVSHRFMLGDWKPYRSIGTWYIWRGLEQAPRPEQE